MIDVPKRRRLSARGGTTAANKGRRGEFESTPMRAPSDEDFQPRARQLTSPADWKARRGRRWRVLGVEAGPARAADPHSPCSSRTSLEDHGPRGSFV